MRMLIAALLALPLAGCFEATRGTIAGGECKVMTRPPYVVMGKAAYDQNWIDNEIEGGVGACSWKRPAPRPAELDAQPARKAAVPKKKPGIAARLKEKAKSIWPAPSPVPQATFPTAPEPEAKPEPPPPPRAPIDELLNPQPARRVYP